jgi:undecaprenyl pyrophosphate phosphatase UppP
MVTAVAACLSVRFLLRSFQTRALTPFAIYRLALGPDQYRDRNYYGHDFEAD